MAISVTASSTTLLVGSSTEASAVSLSWSAASSGSDLSAAIALFRLRGSLPARVGRGAVSGITVAFRGDSSTTTAAVFSTLVGLVAVGADFRGALRSRLG